MTLTKAEKEARREYRRTTHTASKRSGMGIGAWNHRCYFIIARNFNGEPGWKATSVFPALASDVPASFIWTARSDREGMCTYIDALLTGRRSESVRYERDGLVDEIVMPTIDRPEDVNIRANVGRFVDFLSLRDHFDVPLWGRVHFITNGHNVVPVEYLAAISQLWDEETKKHYNLKGDWWHCRQGDLEKMGLKPEDITSGMYRHRYQQPSVDAEAPVAEDGYVEDDPDMVDTQSGTVDPTPTPVTARVASRPSTQPREIEVARRRHTKYGELVTIVQPRRSRAYYVRRMFTYSGQPLWEGTSFYPEGPWTASFRDSAMLLALSVDES